MQVLVGYVQDYLVASHYEEVLHLQRSQVELLAQNFTANVSYFNRIICFQNCDYGEVAFDGLLVPGGDLVY